jgi:hypothetical protein
VGRTQDAHGRAGGPFEIELHFCRPIKECMGDLDNGIKPLMDWLQRVELIEDDKFCDRLLAQWGGPPERVHVRLRPFVKSRRGPCRDN